MDLHTIQDLDIRLEDNQLKAEDFVRLRMAVGFMEFPLEQAERALKNGLFNVAAMHDDEVVGMGRLVGDGAMYWYLQEIIVLPEHQGKGIGKQIVNHLLRTIKESMSPGSKGTIGLVAAKGKETFYEKFGFFSYPTDSCGPGMAMYLTDIK